MQYNEIPCNTIGHNTIPSNTMKCHAIPYLDPLKSQLGQKMYILGQNWISRWVVLYGEPFLYTEEYSRRELFGFTFYVQ